MVSDIAMQSKLIKELWEFHNQLSRYQWLRKRDRSESEIEGSFAGKITDVERAELEVLRASLLLKVGRIKTIVLELSGGYQVGSAFGTQFDIWNEAFAASFYPPRGLYSIGVVLDSVTEAIGALGDPTRLPSFMASNVASFPRRYRWTSPVYWLEQSLGLFGWLKVHKVVSGQ